MTEKALFPSMLYHDWKDIVFAVYLLIALLSSIWIMWGDVVLFTTLGIYAIYSLVPKMHSFVTGFSLASTASVSFKKKWMVFGLASGLTLLLLLINFLGVYPGSFSPDSISQYQQSVTGSYNDWHPVWHTLCTFTLPLKITNGWVPSIILLQIFIFSVCMGYLALIVLLYAGYRFMCVCLMYILLNPYTLEILMYPWKDCGFAISACFCMLFTTQIYFTNGKWGSRMRQIGVFSFMLANATLFRHNGILFTFFLMLALCFFLPRKSWFLLLFTTLLLLVVVKIPVYEKLSVEHPGERVTEMMGLPLTVITSVAKNCPEKLDAETKLFIEELTQPQPNWKENYGIDGFNSIKFNGINTRVIEEKGIKGVMCMMMYCLRVSPKASLKAIVGLTMPVYGVSVVCRAYHGITENDFGISEEGVKSIAEIEQCYARVVSATPLRYIFSTIGSTIMLMFAVILFKSDFTRADDWKRGCLCIPVLTYDFGTMLLLTGHDVRFFLINFLITPLIVLIMAGNKTRCTK